MEKTAYLFCGQGAQYNGMGMDFIENKKVKEIFECGSEIMGWDIATAIKEKSKEQLSQTLISQPAVFAVSLAALVMARQAGIEASAVAGHSLGEYAAMVACGMLSIQDGFHAIKLRSEAMHRAAEKNPGAMAAVLGAKADLIKAVCEEICNSGGYVTPVNYNSPQQTVIAGSSVSLQKAADMLKEKGVRKIIKLAVSAAFHSKLMSEAAEQVELGLKGFAFNKPNLDFYSNVYGKKLTDFTDMPKYLGTHICSPVKFTDELHSLERDGYTAFVELGPDKVLCGLVKKTLENAVAVNIENNESLRTAKEMLLC